MTTTRARAVQFSKHNLAKHIGESFVQFLGIFLLFIVVTAILFWQWMPYLHSALLGPPEDNMQDFWNTWYAAVASNPDHFFFTNLIQFPEGTPLYYHSFAYPKVLAIAAISKVVGADTASLILLQNLSLLISFPLAGTGAFYLVRYFTANTASAMLGGFIFAFNPSHVEHVMHHAHVSSIGFIPYVVLTYLLAIEKKNLLFLFLTIVLYALNALSCWYYLFYIAYFIVFHTVYVAIRDRTWPRGFQLLTPVACLVGIVIVLSPLLVPMIKAAISGASVYAEGSNKYVADVFAYVTFPRYHLLAPLVDGINSRLAGNEWEATVYLGLVNILVLAWLYLVARQEDARLLIYVLCGMVVFCVFASGSTLHVLGHKTIPMPGAIFSHLPFFRNVRTPSRAIVFVYMFLSIGVGYASALAWRYRQLPLVRWGMAAVAALIVLDFFPARRLAITPVTCSPGLAVIRDDPEKGFGVLDLPNGYREGNFYMLQQICHKRAIAQGNTSRKVAVTLRDRLEYIDLQAQRRQLAAAKIKYIVIHRFTKGMRFSWDPEIKGGSQDQYLMTYPVAYDGPDVMVLKVY